MLAMMIDDDDDDDDDDDLYIVFATLLSYPWYRIYIYTNLYYINAYSTSICAHFTSFLRCSILSLRDISMLMSYHSDSYPNLYDFTALGCPE
jgi:hypothetical protein